MTSTKDVRSQFLGYFEGKDHKVLPSSPLIPHNDPTLMFANAGMNQFKNIFTANEPAPYPRAATSQKVVRAGGKHNDLDNVGYTARHLTFFEMLGNFSFGDYFKEKAITYAWEMVTKDFGLPKEKLLATVYHTDDDAFNLWKKISGLPDEKIIRIPTADNFWSMGDTGPCGPCSEIFFDHGDKIPGGPPGSPDEDGDRFVEIWNLVFMQYDQVNKETRVDLPKPCIDTGLGLERFTTVLQGVHTVFDIDLFRHLIAAAEDVIKTKYEGKNIASYRVIADHLRASCFLIADGVLPSNEGRGYVLRRIMRRAMRHAHMLGAKQPVMWKLVPALINEMGEAYPEIKRAEALSVETLRSEETRFQETLERGLKLLEEETEKLSSLLAGERASKERSDAARRVGADAFPPTKTADAVPTPPQGGSGIAFPGEVAFKLYDTFGFPLDLTQDILRGKDIAVDIEGFERSMQEQRERARAAWKGSGDSAVGTLWFDLKEKAGGTEFLGYVNEKSAGNVTAIVKDGAEVSSADKGDKVQVLFNQTPFYGESGGQVGDSGSIMQGKKMVGEVTDTKKMLDNLHIHTVTLHAPLKIGDTVDLVVNQERRARIRANHSATHLLHAALRRHLGEHVTQKGSLVAEDRLRFDISHPKAITAEELKIIEDEVNMMVWQNSEAETKLMKSDEAIHAGAMALFGEKYGDEVRVLTMGVLDERMSGLAAERKSSGTADPLPYSVELCGGIHVKRTGDIGLFKIISEGAIASGVRRIEAVTRDGAFSYLNNEEAMLKGIAADLKTSLEDLPKRISALQEDKKKLERELGDARKKMALGGGGVEAKPEQIGDVQFIGKHFEDLPPKELRGVADSLMKPIKDNGVVMVTSGFEGKASIVIAVSPALTGKHNAAELVKIAAEAVGGKGGGGKPDMAQSGGPDGSKSEEAIEKIKAALR